MADKYVTPEQLGRFKTKFADQLAQGGGGGSARTVDLTVTADELADQTVTKTVAGLGSINLASPIPTDDNIQTWYESTPTIRDHGDDPAIPAGSVQISAVAPSGDLLIRFTVLA